MKKCNNDNGKRYFIPAIKDAGMEVSAALAVATANGRARITNDQIKAALEGMGWTTDGDVSGSSVRIGDGSYSIQADRLAARDLLAWMLNK